MQNVEQQSPPSAPYKKESIVGAFLSLELAAAIVCMAIFMLTIAKYDSSPSGKDLDAAANDKIIEQAMALRPGQLAAQGKLDDAVREAEALIEKKRHNALVNICAGNVFMQANLRDDGLKYLKNAVALSHRNRFVVENYAERLAEAGKDDEAVAQFETLATVKGWTMPHLELAKLYLKMDRPADAATQLKVVLDAQDKNFAVRKLRAVALARSNQMKDGLDEYLRAAQDEAQSGIPDAIRSVLGDKGSSAIDRVTYELQQQINNHPDDYLPKLRLAQLYQYSGRTREDLEQAKDQLLDARRLRPNNAEIQRTLAVVLKQLGEDNQALSAFALSVKLDAQQEKKDTPSN